MDGNIGLDVDISIRCFGEYSYRLTNPTLFYTNVCCNVEGDYTREQIDSQLKSELLPALQPAFAKISEMGVRYSALPGHTTEIAAALNDVLSEKWADLRGVEIVSFGINSVKASEEDEAMIKELQKNAVFRNANMAAAHLVGAQAQAMQDAAKNQGGAFTGFMVMNMVQQGGGINAAQLFQMGAQQQAQAPQQSAPVQPGANAWKCACGAVNTVCIREGRAIGHNTDGTGFLDSLAGQGFYPQGRTVLLLGAGGAAKAVGHALATAGAGRVIVCARRLERAAALAAQLPGCGEGIVLAQDAIQQAASACDLLVNATPLGMAGSPAFARLDFLQAMPPHAVVYDLVYHPRRTALLEAAARQGLRTVGGIDLLIRQAVRAFTFFTGETPDTAALYAALREPLGLA